MFVNGFEKKNLAIIFIIITPRQHFQNDEVDAIAALNTHLAIYQNKENESKWANQIYVFQYAPEKKIETNFIFFCLL